MVARELLALAAREIGGRLADQEVLLAADQRDRHLADHLETVLDAKIEERSKRDDAVMRLLGLDVLFGRRARRVVLALGVGPLVVRSGRGHETVQIRLREGRTADAVLLQHENADRIGRRLGRRDRKNRDGRRKDECGQTHLETHNQPESLNPYVRCRTCRG